MKFFQWGHRTHFYRKLNDTPSFSIYCDPEMRCEDPLQFFIFLINFFLLQFFNYRLAYSGTKLPPSPTPTELMTKLAHHQLGSELKWSPFHLWGFLTGREQHLPEPAL